MLFGNYSYIHPKPDTIRFLMDSFSDKELVPTTWQELTINGTTSRLSLENSDSIWKIEFGSNRIEIVHSNVDGNEFLELPDFLNEAKNIQKTLSDKFQMSHNRLSLLTRLVVNEKKMDEANPAICPIINTIDYHNTNKIVDWSSRVVSRITSEIDGNPEVFNVISNLKYINFNQVTESDEVPMEGTELLFDINTFQGTTDFRFGSEHVNQFLDSAFAIEQSLRNQYIDLITN